MENNKLFWERLFGVQGCPAHVWEDYAIFKLCQGYCCKKCPPSKRVFCKQMRCGCEPSTCGCGGRVDRETVFRIYKSRKWESLSEFLKAIWKVAR